MTTSAIYDVIDALVDLLPAVVPDGCNVFDGYPDTDDPGLSYLAVGVPDPNDDGAANAGDSRQEWATIGAQSRDEAGDVWCVAVFETGDGTARDARDGVKAITSAVEGLLRTNYALGVSTLLWTSYGTSTDLQQDLTDQGAVAQVVFSVHFRARI